MAFQHREGQGALFKNERRTSDNAPGMRGTILVGGVLYEVSAWRKEGRDGKPPWLSLQAKPAQDRGAQRGGGRPPARDVTDDDIPF